MKSLTIFLFTLLGFSCLAQTSGFRFNADSLISLMTLEEKIGFISGHENFNIKGLDRLGIPQIKMADGPMGVNGHGKATAFPASICMAATWNPDLIKQMSGAIAKEAKSKGIGVLLAPGVNMYRVPHCGRNFEYYGEDPFLTSQMTVSFIQGVQNQNVIATVKHFVANNQDYDRHRVSSDIDERTLNEIYFPAFKAAVQEAEVGAIMTSYNLLNGTHTSESSLLIKEILKEKWGFEGIVMSDWISVYSIKAFDAGLDLEMPRSQFMNKENILPLIKANASSEDILDDKVRRILNTCNRIGLYDSKATIDSVDWIKHKHIARQVAREGFVLLKNTDNLLPINTNAFGRILVLGPNALFTPYSGGGAAMIDVYEMTSFYEGIKNNAPTNHQVDYLSVEGIYHLNSSINYSRLKKELKKLKNYDVVILCLGFNSKTEGEAFDHPFEIPENQQKLIEEVAELQENLIIVLNAGGGVKMPWLDKTKSLIYAWYPGQEGGNALGEIIFGKVNPSGKLPISIEKQWKDNAAFNTYDTTNAIPGVKPFYTLYGKEHQVENMKYEEGIFTGYRHFEKNKIEPLFPFGFGLSYSTFKYSNLITDKNTMTGNDSITIKLTIENTGKFDGYETIQVYISDLESSLPRPVKELKAFKKVFLKTGENRICYFTITKQMLEFYHPDNKNWIREDGEFEILIGSSSSDIQLARRIKYSN